MKRRCLAFIFILGIAQFLLVVSAHAQSSTPTPVFDFQKAYQDFVFNFDKYRSTHDDYELARSQYLQSQTLAAQAKAQEATYNMLFARDEVVRSYLTMLRMRLGEAVGVSVDRREFLFTKIDQEVNWFTSHQSLLSSASSLEDQVADSNDAKTQYDRVTEALVYDVLTEISLGKQYFLRQKQVSIISDLESKLNQIRSDEQIDIGQIERWLLETKNLITRSEGKEQDVLVLQAGFAKSKKRSDLFNQIQFRVNESIQYLKDANDFLLETIKTIRNS